MVKHINKTAICILFLFSLTSVMSQSIIGDWDGTLEVTGFSLEMFITVEAGEDELEGSLDIPAQILMICH